MFVTSRRGVWFPSPRERSEWRGGVWGGGHFPIWMSRPPPGSVLRTAPASPPLRGGREKERPRSLSRSEVTVIGIPDAYRGQSAKAFVVLKPGQPAFGIDELKAFLADKLAKYEMPTEMEIRESLPKTPVGKLSKKELVAEELAKRRAPRGAGARDVRSLPRYHCTARHPRTAVFTDYTGILW